MENLNDEIKQLRKKSGASLSQIEAGGVNKMTYLRVEKGKHSPSVLTLKKIVNALGFDLKIKFVKNQKKK